MSRTVFGDSVVSNSSFHRITSCRLITDALSCPRNRTRLSMVGDHRDSKLRPFPMSFSSRPYPSNTSRIEIEEWVAPSSETSVGLFRNSGRPDRDLLHRDNKNNQMLPVALVPGVSRFAATVVLCSRAHQTVLEGAVVSPESLHRERFPLRFLSTSGSKRHRESRIIA